MLPHPKDDAAKAESVRITKLLKWFVHLPIPRLLLSLGWVKRLFVTPKTEAILRTAEKERQAGIRRELRGLPAEHEGGMPVAALEASKPKP